MNEEKRGRGGNDRSMDGDKEGYWRSWRRLVRGSSSDLEREMLKQGFLWFLRLRGVRMRNIFTLSWLSVRFGQPNQTEITQTEKKDTLIFHDQYRNRNQAKMHEIFGSDFGLVFWFDSDALAVHATGHEKEIGLSRRTAPKNELQAFSGITLNAWTSLWLKLA